jgi:hypothetical protein
MSLSSEEIINSLRTRELLTYNYKEYKGKKLIDSGILKFKIIKYITCHSNGSIKLLTDHGFYINLREDGTVTIIDNENKNKRYIGTIIKENLQ